MVADCFLQQPEPRPGQGPAIGSGLGLTAAALSGLGSGVGMGEGVALSGWTNESIVWTSDQLPYVATYNDVRVMGWVT